MPSPAVATTSLSTHQRQQYIDLDMERRRRPLSRIEEAYWHDLHSALSTYFDPSYVGALLDYRESLRIPFNAQIQYTFHGRTYRATTQDISQAGFRIPYNSRLKPGILIAVKLLRPAAQQPQLKMKRFTFRALKRLGMIAWVDPFTDEMGVEYLPTTRHETDQIATWIYQILLEN